MVTKFKVKLTSKNDTKPAVVNVDKQKIRRQENEEYLKNSNVKAFLGTISWAEGGKNYHAQFGYGWAKGGPWEFKDESTHPGAGYKGVTAAGLYQITYDTWQDHGIKSMGLTDFSPHTQDLITVDILRLPRIKAIDALLKNDIKAAVAGAALRWEALPLGPGKANRKLKGKPSNQPYKPYNEVVEKYISLGGKTIQ